MSIILQGLGGNLISQGYGVTSVVPGISTLIVEDGSGQLQSDSFCSVDFADDYNLKRGNTGWAILTVVQKDEALRKATDYMEQTYRLRWLGYRSLPDQWLSWPRWDVYTLELAGSYGWANSLRWRIVPDLVKRACAELALRASIAPLTRDVGRLKKRTRIGPIDIHYESSSHDQNLVYTSVDNMLRPILQPFARAGGMYTAHLERA